MARNFYAQILREWDWESVVRDAHRHEGMFFLGTVFSVMPSGKYYMPFSCSNVELCPRCGGTGQTRKQYPCEYCAAKGSRVITEDMLNWPVVREHGRTVGDLLPCGVCRESGYVPHSCRLCGGLGSEEAYRDERYRDALEKVAEKYGGWIENGEGDPCDLFFCLPTLSEELDDLDESDALTV